ncbi:MAG TPA: hotdog domain-containing protein [Jatrophihabitantaceae bacterium]|jgi:acyl-coenzyme A thioesterase PaaI-like protein
MSLARPSQVPGALQTSDARRSAAEVLRGLGVALLSHEVDDDTLRELAAGLRAATDTVLIGPPRVRSFAEITLEPEADEVAEGEELGHFDGCFVTGEASPIGLAVRAHRDGDGLAATASFPRSFEGMPGYAHGGIVLAVFDDLIGLTIGRLLRISAPTVRVEVDFRKPVPLDRDIEFRTRLISSDGRKRVVTATATIGDMVHAEAQALLIVLPPDYSIGA